MTHEVWIDCDLPWVAVADAVLLLKGKSVGAELECSYARDHGVPVFRDKTALLDWRERQWMKS